MRNILLIEKKLTPWNNINLLASHDTKIITHKVEYSAQYGRKTTVTPPSGEGALLAIYYRGEGWHWHMVRNYVVAISRY